MWMRISESDFGNPYLFIHIFCLILRITSIFHIFVVWYQSMSHYVRDDSGTTNVLSQIMEIYNIQHYKENNMGISILIADDDDLLRDLIKEVLEEAGYQVYDVADGECALDIFWKHSDIGLVILDVMMPKLDGITVLEEMRERSDIPIIMLTALGDSLNELSCLRKGASDFISKPFHYEILVERVKNLLKLTKAEIVDCIQLGILKMCPMSHKVYVNQKEVVLNNKEYQLLEFLINNENIVLTREKILDRIWGYDYEGDMRTIDTHIKMLRASLGEAGNYIKTIRGVGYCFEVRG